MMGPIKNQTDLNQGIEQAKDMAYSTSYRNELVLRRE